MSRDPEVPVVSLEVSFASAPPEGMVTPLCQSLSELCGPLLLGDDDAASRLRLTAHELLENVVKYSSGPCTFRFQLFKAETGKARALVETSNVPAPTHRAEADQRLAALCAAPDPLEHYDSIIADSARRPAGSGLGLARIHAETEFRLSHRFEAEQLVIAATGEVWLKGGAA